MDDKYQLLEERVQKLESEVKALKEQTNRNSFREKPFYSQKNYDTWKRNTPSNIERKATPLPSNIESKATAPNPVKPMQKSLEPTLDLEKVLIQWMPRVFMIILLIGLLWGLKIGMDNGFITNPIRVILGYSGTVLLAWLGYKQYINSRHALGLSLIGGMVALGMVTTFAAHSLYQFFGVPFALIINLVFVVIGIFLSHKLKSETLAVFCAFGAFLIPFLLESTSPSTLFFCIYILSLFLALFYLSLRENHKYTFYVIFGLFHITLFTFLNATVNNQETIIALTVLIQHLFLLLMFVRNKVSVQVFSEVLLYTNFLFGIGWLKLFNNSYEPYMYGGLAIIYIGLALHSYKQDRTSLQSVLSAISVFAVGVFLLSFNFVEQRMYTLLLVLESTLGLWLAFQFKNVRMICTSGLIYLLTSLFIVTSQPVYEFFSFEHMLWISFLTSLMVLYVAGYRYLPKHFSLRIKTMDISLTVGQLLFLIYFGMILQELVSYVDVTYAMALHLQLFGLFLLVLSFYKAYLWSHGKYMSYVGFAVILLMIPAFLLVPYLYGSHLEFIAMLLIELIFLATLIYFTHLVWKKKFTILEKKLLDKFGSIIISMQIIIFLFVNKWTFGISAQFNISSDYVYFIHSFVLLFFAFASTTAGRKFSWRWVRILGVILIGVTIFKLFFIDLVQVSIVVRAILFILVGITGVWYSRTLYQK
ncbi:DUF2339 domain-containing protein [Bacillus suaedae]|uniref:DUF2339 domain-containing protein n=1 Tax=Halalkalibacter suaedae TaxID=2822140 RepID=A0A940WZD9_9BACI|nr:DUF2339 domain-containing protein [Bacillus suaedae]MBP3951570.1 DUF2339 domain-containing protein [Bacillus suaedae]